MGLPVLYAGPEGPNVDQAIVDYGCGFSLRQGDVAGLADAIRRPPFRPGPGRGSCHGMHGARSRRPHSDRSALPRFDALLEELTRSGS